ncbi:MAG: phosphotransferase [Vulcanibacillus sp.]
MTLISQYSEIGVHPHVFSEYNIQINNLSKIKSIIKIETEVGKFALKKTKVTDEQVNRMMTIIKFLDDNRFPVSEIIPNKYGELYVPTLDGIIYLTKWIEGKAFSINDNKHLALAISTLANLHKLGFGFDPKELKYQYIEETFIKKSWIESIDWLKKYQKRLELKESNTAFEHIFRTYIPFLRNWAEEAVEHLNDWVIEYNSIRDIRKTICHGKYYHRNIVITPDDYLILIDFDHVGLDTPVRDIAFFIRNYLLSKEYQKWVEIWINTYLKINPLLAYEKKLLLIYLLFPEKIINLAKRYEKKQKNLSDEIYFKKLQVRWAQTKELIWFVDRQGWLYE